MAISSSVNDGDDAIDAHPAQIDAGDASSRALSAAELQAERPGDRLLINGAASLSTAELLALCLGGGVPRSGVPRSGVPREDALGLARRLLTQFGNLDNLLAAAPRSLLSCRGLGKARVARLKAVRELACRDDEIKLAMSGIRSGITSGAMSGAMSDAVTDANTVVRYVRRRIGYCQREVFGCLFLDTRHRPIRWEILFKGTVNRAHVHSREILKRALELNAAAMVLGHNHPSGVAEPSTADIALTRELRDLLMRIDIVLLDHIIVAQGHGVSLANRGLMGTA